MFSLKRVGRIFSSWKGSKDLLKLEGVGGICSSWKVLKDLFKLEGVRGICYTRNVMEGLVRFGTSQMDLSYLESGEGITSD